MDDLYEQYGRLMIQLEIVQGQVAEVKGKIAKMLKEGSKKKDADKG